MFSHIFLSSTCTEMVWNRKTRNTALAWARRATTMKYLHFIVSQHYQKISQYLTAPSALIMGGVGTGLIGVAAAETGSVVSQVFLWILATLSFIATGFAAVNWELDPSKLSEKHLHKSVCWGGVADDLVLELSLNPTEQHDEKWFFSYIQKQMLLTENLPPVIPNWAFELQPSHVMKGEMGKDLLELDRRFGTALGIVDAGAPLVSNSSTKSDLQKENVDNQEQESVIEMEDIPSVGPIDSDHIDYDYKQDKEIDVNLLLEESFETEDYIQMDAMRSELEKKQREIRQDLKRCRRAYHMNRLFGEQQFPMKPPPSLKEVKV